MRAHVGGSPDYIVDDNDNDENLPLPEDYRSNNIVKARYSSDKNGVSGHGSDLLRFCKSTQFRIMNRRWEKGVDEGKFTCINPKGSSVVDYCLIREESLDLVKNWRFNLLFRPHYFEH